MKLGLWTMEINSKRRKLLGTIVAGGVMHGCGGSSDSASALPAQPAPDDSPGTQLPTTGQSLPSFNAPGAQPIYIAHRGGAALYPEGSYVAYDKCIGDGQLFLECDVYTLADGTLGIMHDETVDRTTSGTGRVDSFTRFQWENLRIDGDSWHGSNFGNQLAVPTFVNWVARYNGKGLLCPESKDLRSTAAMVAVLAAAKVKKDHVLISSFGLSSLAAATAAGYPTCWLTSLPYTPQAAAAGVRWIGIAADRSDGTIKDWVASGISVFAFTVNRRHERDSKLALGVRGLCTDDPVYLSGNLPISSADRFDLGTWSPGMLGSNGDIASVSRGKFFGDGYWGYDDVTAGYLGCLHGYLCPIKGQVEVKTFSIDFKVKYGAALKNDATRWASVFIGLDDRAFVDKDELAAGYHFLLRKNGLLEILKKAPGAVATRIISTNASAFADGDEGSFRVSVMETTITLARLHADGSPMSSVMVNDTTYRGAYLHFGRSGLACAFRKITVT